MTVTPVRGLTAQVRLDVGPRLLPAARMAIGEAPIAIDGLHLHATVVEPIESQTACIDGDGWADVLVAGVVEDEIVRPRRVAVGRHEGVVTAHKVFPEIALTYPLIIPDRRAGGAINWLLQRAIEPFFLGPAGNGRTAIFMTALKDRDRIRRFIIGDRPAGHVDIQALPSQIIDLGSPPVTERPIPKAHKSGPF